MEGWKKFEHLVARLHKAVDGDYFSVEHDVTVIEPSGAEHQIDVLLTPKNAFSGPILVSCKSSRDPVGIEHVREWADIVQQTGAAAGVIVSPTGFTAGAIEAARTPTRRVSLWTPRRLTDHDFAPDERSPNGYVRSIVTTLHVRYPRPRVETFTLDVESTSGKHEGRTITSRFSAQTRDRYYLRDEHDNVVGNLWDQYIASAELVHVSGPARVESAEPCFLMFDGHRVRFKSLSIHIDVNEFDMTFETDLAKLAFAYENAITGRVKFVPLPSNLLSE